MSTQPTLFGTEPATARRRQLVKLVKCGIVRDSESKPVESCPLTRPTDAAKLFEAWRNEDREHFLIALLDARNRPTAVNVVSMGTLNASLVHPREVFKPAILASSASIILCHNHPSGDTSPSRDDMELTRRLVSAGEILGIEILDHVIIAPDADPLSMREACLI